ncbi:hypothetical protein HaLaN_09594 [Haematococcus lacustris]|uniref:Uncharacterized protein n=1 Tax=Haematococcus lacustris TaxID=44745 RepID=A0A699YWS5_HAELA|nr:hypothetical protein HaLaN_09594 [Haematococcus lacustris]
MFPSFACMADVVARQRASALACESPFGRLGPRSGAATARQARRVNSWRAVEPERLGRVRGAEPKLEPGSPPAAPGGHASHARLQHRH